MHKDKWLLTAAHRPAASVRLYGFPYAGAGASVFRDWHKGLPGSLEISGVQLPGRENRFSERRLSRIEDVVEALLLSGAIRTDRPFFFFGHSLGALIAFEVTRAMQCSGMPSPFHLVVSGTRAPTRHRVEEPVSRLPDDAFLDHILRFGGTPPEVSGNPEVMELLLPQMRDDFAMFENWSSTDRTPVTCPVTAFGGDVDPKVSNADIEAWGSSAGAGFKHRMFPGDHFFIQPARLEILDELRSIAASASRVRETEVLHGS